MAGVAVTVTATAIWDGVYASFAEAPVSGPGFRGDTWLERSRAEAVAPLTDTVRQRHAALVHLVAGWLCYQPWVRIFDLGGGLGSGYRALHEAIPRVADRVAYASIDLPSIAEAAMDIWGGSRTYPVFTSDWPYGGFDLVYAASSLQYFDNWREILGTLLAYQPKAVLLADVFAGPIPSFVTVQHYYGSYIPQWFLNRAELERVFKEQGYRLAMARPTQHQIPMDNFPATHQIPHTLDLLFQKATS